MSLRLADHKPLHLGPILNSDWNIIGEDTATVGDFNIRLIPLTTVPQDAVPAAGPGIPGGIRAAARKVGIRVGCGCAGAPAGAVAGSGRGIRPDQARPPTMS